MALLGPLYKAASCLFAAASSPVIRPLPYTQRSGISLSTLPGPTPFSSTLEAKEAAKSEAFASASTLIKQRAEYKPNSNPGETADGSYSNLASSRPLLYLRDLASSWPSFPLRASSFVCSRQFAQDTIAARINRSTPSVVEQIANFERACEGQCIVHIIVFQHSATDTSSILTVGYPTLILNLDSNLGIADIHSEASSIWRAIDSQQ